MNAARGGPLRPLRSPLFLKIQQWIGIKIGSESTRASFGDSRRLEALQFVAQLAVALLRRIEIGEPLSGIRRRGGLRQGNARINDAWRREDERRDMRGSNARPRRLFGVGHHCRGDGGLGFGERVRGKAGPKLARRRESGQVEAVVAGALELRQRRPPRFGQAVFGDPNRRISAPSIEGRDRPARGAPVA